MSVSGIGGSISGDFIDIHGLRIHVSVRAGGSAGNHTTPLLLLMGLGGHLGLWQPLQRFLGDIETVAFDAPGAGASPAPAVPLYMSRLARVTIGVLDKLGYERVDVLGFSLGGALAQQLAFQTPHRVRRLILVATSCGIGSVPGIPMALMRLAVPFPYSLRLSSDILLGEMFGGTLRTDPALARHVAAVWSSSRLCLWGYYSQMYSLWGWSSLTWLPRIQQPTLVLTGDDDPLTPAINSRILASRLPNAQLRVVRGGHLFLMERSDEVAALVRGLSSFSRVFFASRAVTGQSAFV